jgi:hypothetical protein
MRFARMGGCNCAISHHLTAGVFAQNCLSPRCKKLTIILQGLCLRHEVKDANHADKISMLNFCNFYFFVFF